MGKNLHWNYVSKMTSNVPSRMQFLVIKWRTYCSKYAPMLYCSKYNNAFAYLIDAMIRLTLFLNAPGNIYGVL